MPATSTWEARFRPASYGAVVAPSAGPWRVLHDPGDLAPADLVAAEVLHFLRSDPILASVFEDRFERLPFISHDDTRPFPRCSVHLVSATESERPTSVVMEEVSVFVAALWTLQAVRPATEGGASVATVMTHIKRVLRAPRNRTLIVTYQGNELSLASEAVRISNEGFGALQDVSGRPFGIVHEVQTAYTLRVDRNTGLFTVFG